MLQAVAILYADERGEVAISYGLIAALISIAAIIAMTQLGETIPHLFNLVGQEMIDGLQRAGLL
jgi:pilus assembly protein Flp/PilA